MSGFAPPRPPILKARVCWHEDCTEYVLVEGDEPAFCPAHQLPEHVSFADREAWVDWLHATYPELGRTTG